ncbi:hypothetical protein [Cohnella hongkongensis]|uniref:Uncharacterized protein n=1 Tax=Cohnella hongkongensis TaxID=178337 RepID=A0ABV9FB12_9BACL
MLIQDVLNELGQKSKRLIEGCATPAHDGTVLFTPDGIASYNALWVRDFGYMVEYAGAYLQDASIEKAIRFIINARREDGWMPDRVYSDGTAVFAAGEAGKPVGQANLDNTPFLVFVVYFYLNRIAEDKAAGLYREWKELLRGGLDLIVLSESGLVYNDPADPHSPYGFTDTIGKTGELFKESLLYWRSCKFLAELDRRFGDGRGAGGLERRASAVESAIFRLYDEESGAFFAASQDCRQLDIWGIAYMLYIDFPAAGVKDRLLAFLKDQYGNYVYKGQIRHLLKGEYWDRLLIDVPREEYQNGAYWATATGWVVWCLAQIDAGLAAKTVKDALDSFEHDGIFECVNEGYGKLDSFVVSATNVYGAVDRLVNAEKNAGFIDQMNRL